MEMHLQASLSKPGGTAMHNFLQGITNEETREGYTIKLRLFLEHARLDADGFVELARSRPHEAEKAVVDYVISRRGTASGATIRNFKVALKLFLAMNDAADALNWTRIGKVIPTARRHGSDRAPTMEELKKILDSCDLRMKCVVLLMVSGGIRIGAFNWLRWGDVEPLKFGTHEFARLTVYRGENEEYQTFVTPECYRYLLDYRAMREGAGERVIDGSPLIRDDWGGYKGATDPSVAKAVAAKTLRNQLGRLYKKIGLRVAKEGRWYEFKTVHGFRKFFKSNAERYIKSIYVEIMMGHSTGVSDSYMKPSERDMVQEYVKAIPALTILSREEVTKDDLGRVKEEARMEAVRAFASMVGVDPMKLRIEKQRELGREPTPDEEMELMKVEIKKLREPQRDAQMLVKEDELQRYLAEGWHFVSALPSQRILIRR